MKHGLLRPLLIVPLTAACTLLLACQESGTGQDLDAGERASVIRIVDSWIGLSPASPRRASFELRLADDGSYVGPGRYSVGPAGPGQLHDSAEVVIPAGAVDSFYVRLGRIEPEPGSYEPRITHTDDYPHLTIELELGPDTLRLYSSSQGPGHVPWGLKRGGVDYVVDSSLPFDALAWLRPHLRMEMLERLVHETQRER